MENNKALHTYIGIGSVRVPNNVFNFLFKTSLTLGVNSKTLRSVNEPGVSAAFAKGSNKAASKKEVYLPSINYRQSDSPYYLKSDKVIETAKQLYQDETTQPNEKEKSNIALGAHIFVGPHEDKVLVPEFILTWTYKGEAPETFSTLWALSRLSEMYNVPMYNLGKEGVLDKFKEEILSPQNIDFSLVKA